MAEEQPVPENAPGNIGRASESSLPNRREWFAAVVAALSVDGMHSGKEWLAARNIRSVAQLEPITSVKNEPERLTLLAERFFRSTGEVKLIAPSHHPLVPTVEFEPGVVTYRADFAAYKSLRGLFGRADQVLDSPLTVDTRGALICVGSGISNEIAREILGDPHREPTFKTAWPGRELRLPYALHVTDNKRVVRWQGDALVRTPAYALRSYDGKTIFPATGMDDLLQEDFLVVTRLPSGTGGSATIFAGVHAPGTRAIDLLLNQIHTSELTALYDFIGTAEYFQALFLVTGLRQEGRMTIPQHIELVKNVFPPVRLS